MRIDLQTEQPTMQETIDLVALAIRETVEVLRSPEIETTDEALTNISGNLDRLARDEPDNPRLALLLSGLANQVMATNESVARTGGGRLRR